MSSKLSLLRQILSRTSAAYGSVIAVQGRTAQVATPGGTSTAAIPQGVLVQPGDPVKLQDGILIGRVRDKAALRVYDL